MIKSTCLTAIALLLLTFVDAAYANPAPIGSPGTALAPFSLKSLPGVSIVEERLNIKDGLKGKIPSPAPGGGTMDVPCVQYRAWYQFENNTGKPMKVLVGFPVIVYSEQAGGSYGGLTSLTAEYGGKQLLVKESTTAKPTVYPRARLGSVANELVQVGLAQTVIESSDFIQLKKLGSNPATAEKTLRKSGAFSEKQIKRVLGVLKKVVFANNDDSLTGQSLVWSTFELTLPKGLSEPLICSYSSFVPFGEDYSFSYVLSSGRLWGHNIRRMRIEIEPDADFLKNGGQYQIFPENKFSRSNSDGHFVFASKNTSPTFDIYVRRVESDHGKPTNEL